MKEEFAKILASYKEAIDIIKTQEKAYLQLLRDNNIDITYHCASELFKGVVQDDLKWFAVGLQETVDFETESYEYGFKLLQSMNDD